MTKVTKATKEHLICKCCKEQDSSTMQSDMLCNACFTRCRCKADKCCKASPYRRVIKAPSGVSQVSHTYKSCHGGPVLVISSYSGLSIYGASRTEAKDNFSNFDLVISLGEENVDVTANIVIRSIGLLRLLKVKPSNTEHIVLAWPDFSIPSLSREFWINLSRVLKKKGRDRIRTSPNNVYKVMIHCMGGHGRTGTCLGILGNLIGGWNSNLVERVREVYCHEAVESKRQIDYIEKITGIIRILKSKSDIEDYFKNRSRWRKDYPS